MPLPPIMPICGPIMPSQFGMISDQEARSSSPVLDHTDAKRPAVHRPFPFGPSCPSAYPSSVTDYDCKLLQDCAELQDTATDEPNLYLAGKDSLGIDGYICCMPQPGKHQNINAQLNQINSCAANMAGRPPCCPYICPIGPLPFPPGNQQPWMSFSKQVCCRSSAFASHGTASAKHSTHSFQTKAKEALPGLSRSSCPCRPCRRQESNAGGAARREPAQRW